MRLKELRTNVIHNSHLSSDIIRVTSSRSMRRAKQRSRHWKFKKKCVKDLSKKSEGKKPNGNGPRG